MDTINGDTLFKDNKYRNWYFNIINSARSTPLQGYTEKHHIIPRALGGLNVKDNIVSLSAREHYICHLLLTKFVKDEFCNKMINALWFLSNKNTVKVNSRLYSKLKQDLSSLRKGNTFGKNNKGIPKTTEHRAKIAACAQAFKKGHIPWNKGIKTGPQTKTTIYKRNQSRAKYYLTHTSPFKGHRHSEETRFKISAANKGKKKPQSESHKANRLASYFRNRLHRTQNKTNLSH
jgi:hypothetical protein